MNGHPLPRVNFASEAESCPGCGGSLQIQKSKRRTVITLVHGAFEACEVRRGCGQGNCPPVGSEALRKLVKPGQRYGYDLIVNVGLRRYLAGEQREEIRGALLEKYDITLSTGTISALCDRFLSLLEALHVHRAPQLRAAQQGGYPLHIDATCERGKGGLFVCMDGWRSWVLWAGRVDSEAAEHLAPLIERTVTLFGNPIAVVRDMGEGGAGAVKTLREAGIPDLICHYHFVAAIGTKLFDKLHHPLCGMIRVAGTRAKMRALLADLGRYGASRDGRFGPGSVRDGLKALVLWILEGDGSKDAPFPFALPHLEFVRRCRQAIERAEQWVPCPRTQPERRAIRHLSYLVSHLERDRRLPPIVQRLEERWCLFSELRDVLRLSNAQLPHGQPAYLPQQLPALELLRLEQIKRAVDDYQAKLEKGLPFEESNASRPSSAPAIILKYLKRYGAHLFGHPARIDSDGQVTAVVGRTNNILEQFFGQEKRQLRRRLGRAQLGRDLEQQPAQVALVANLRSAAYVRVLCGSLDHLPAALAALDIEASAKTAALVRDHRDKELQDCVRKLLTAPPPPSIPRADPIASISQLEGVDLTARWPELEPLSDDELRARCAAVFAPPRKNGTRVRDPRLPPAGTVLTRRFRDRTYRVLVGENGFEYDGKRHTSLSSVAKKVAGTTYSGYRFFHLKGPWDGRPAKRSRGRRRPITIPPAEVATES